MPRIVQRLLRQLRADYRRAIITLFGSSAVLVIFPFAILRFAQGNWLAGFADFLIVIGIACATGYAWRGGDLTRAGVALLLITQAGCLALAALLGPVGVLWLFPATLANFLLVRPRLAAAATMLSITAVQFIPDAFQSSLDRLSVAVTLSVVAVFAYVFALGTAAQREELEELATRDALTGALNRRAMDAEVLIAINAHQRSGRPVTLMMLDLDHFKRVNDQHGHEVGDMVLRDFVAILKSVTRGTDRLFRYGGEEFALLMEHTDEIAVGRAFANLRRQVHESLAANGDPVTVSAGAAVLRHGEDREAWFARADAALYRAKQGGRHRLEVDGRET